MSQKLTLAVYLQGRGSVKSLTRIEAEAFSVPYPLVSGWPARYGNVGITAAMLEDLAQRIAGAKRSTASKALRGLEGVVGEDQDSRQRTSKVPCKKQLPYMLAPNPNEAISFPGFALRRAKRWQLRRA